MIQKYLPNTLTCCNLLCGLLGVIYVFEGDLSQASIMIFLAAVFDFFDGFAARKLHAHSAIGKELDSLADMVTFGALPALILYKMIQQGSMDMETPRKYVALLVGVFSALRLAKFNIDTRQTDSFIGLPTPANALFVAALPMVIMYQPAYAMMVLNPIFLVIYSLLISFLMVSEIPMFALKFKNWTWEANKIPYLFLGFCTILLIVFQYLGLALCIAAYAVLSVVTHQFPLKK